MTIHGYAKRLSAALITLLLLLTAAACSPSDGGLETYPSDGGSVALPTDTAFDGDTSSDGDASSEGETSVNTAPDFAILDMDGKEVRLSDFFGTPIVLNFWASWCGPCKAEMPAFQTAFETYGQDIQFMMVNMTDGTYETRLSAANFIQQMGYTFPVFYDPYYSAVNAYEIVSIPTTFFISADGYIVAQAVGKINALQLQNYLEMLLP